MESLWAMLLRRYKGSANVDSSKADSEVQEKLNKPKERGSSGSRGMGNERDSSIPPPAR